MKLRHRLLVLILAFAMLVTGSGIVSFAETMGDDISSVDMSAESVSKDADAASADDQADADEEAAEAEDNSAEEAAQDAGDALDEEAAEESGSQDADSNSNESADAGDSSDTVEDADAADDHANETPAEENNEDAEDATAYSAGTLTYECDEYTVTLDYGKTAEIPEGTKLEVREVVADSDSKKEQKEYEGYYDTSLEQLRSETGGDSIAKLGFARFYDITLINDGAEIEPSGDVSVKFEFSKDAREKVSKKDDAEKNLRVVHITENEKTGELEAAALDINDTELSLNKKELSEASFTTDSFSVYGIVYTVDFEYDTKQTEKSETVVEAKGKTFRMEAAYDSDAGIPEEGVRLSAKELKDDDPDTVTFDIKIVSESDDSVVYQPAEGHNVALTVVVLDKKADTDEDTASVLHVSEDGTEEMLTADLEATDEGYVYSFETESFSTFTLYRTGTNSNESFITTVKTGRFGGSQTELSGTARISNNNATGWLSFDEVVAKWNQAYTNSGSNGRYSVLRANDAGGTRHQALCSVGFFEGYVGPIRSHVAVGRFATSEDVNGSGASYDLQIELNDNSLPVRITANGTTTDKVFVPSGNATSFTPESIAEELGYSTDGMAVSGKINNMSTDSVSRAQLTTTDIPTVSSGNGWWSRLLAGESFNFAAGSSLVASDTNYVSYPATNVSYPAAYKWTYDNGGTQTVIGDTPYEIKIIPAVAQVSNDGGRTWKKFACLISGNYDGEPLEGAFDYANSLTRDVIVEMLYDTHERYTLGSGFNFNNTGISSLTINGVNDKSTLTKNQTTASMITTTGIDTVEFNKIIFNGNGPMTVVGNGGAVNTDADSLIVSDCIFNNCQAGKTGSTPGQGGGICHDNTAGEVSITNCEFNNCKANGKEDTAAGGGGFFTNAQTLTVTGSKFTGCQTASRQGAGFFHRRAKTDPANSETLVTGCKFENCEAKWSGGGLESDAWKVTLDTVEFTNCKATKGGAINVWADGQDSTSNNTTLNVTKCKFKDCTGTDNGGAVRSTSLYTNLSDSSFERCSSKASGGAVACTSNKTIATVTGCSFTDCIAVNLGGAIHSAGTKANATTVKDTTITGGSARNGGAIRSGNIILENVTISDCTATQQGGAVHSTQTITIKGGSITGCTTNGDSAAVEAETSASGIVLSGDVVVAGNTGSSGENRDVFIRYDTDRQILIAPAGLGGRANIGVYTPDRDSIYDNHGKPGKLFAHTGDVQASSMSNLDKLFNDRTIGDMPVLRGVAAVPGTSNEYRKRVMWEEYIARVSNDGGQTWTYHAYLVNSAVSSTQQNGATVKEGAFDQASTLSGDVIIETLYETHPRYTVTKSTEFNKADTTYTLRTTQDNTWNPDGFTSTIYRGWNGSNNGAGAILHINNATTTFTTGDIILDGDKDGSVTGAARAGRAIYVTNGSLSANGKTTIRNFNMNADGGAVYAANDLTYTVSNTGNLLFDNCSTTKNGGAIYAAKALTLTPEGTTTFTSCMANNGGGIYQAGTGDLTLTNVTFGKAGDENKGCFAEIEGGSVYSKGTNTTITDCDFYYSQAGSGSNGNNTHGGAVCHYGSGEHKILGCVFDHCSAKTTSTAISHGNGGAVYISENGTSLIVDKSDTRRRSTFTNCSARRYGGAVIMEKNGGCTLRIKNSDFADCNTDYMDGGAVYTDSNVTSIKDCTFKRCHSDSANGENNGGGAIYTNGDTPYLANTITITDCKFEDCYVKRNGGAIHFYSTGTDATLNNVQITGAKGVLGSAVYSRGNVTIIGGEIKDCSASAEKGGAVNVYSGKTVYFEGDAVIRKNTNTSHDTGNEHNVILDQNRNLEIQTTSTGLGANADIGIYVTGKPADDPFKDHGSFKDDFGTYASGGSTANFDRFINDRVVDSNGDKLRGELCPEPGHTTQRLIRWIGVEPVSPTGYNRSYTPFLFILFGGLVLAAIASGQFRRKMTEETED